MRIEIREGTPMEAYQVAGAIPEFNHQLYHSSTYQQRLAAPCSILIANIDRSVAGFKVGYQRGAQGSFYSWMGGVLPRFRRMGVAQALADHQESWAVARGYKKLWFKTRNRNRAMLHFAINRGFYLVEIIPNDKIQDYRIILEKTLNT